MSKLRNTTSEMTRRFSRLRATARARWNALPENTRRYGALAFVLVAGIWIGNLLFSERHEHATGAEVSDLGEQVAEVWTCSMHPQVRQPGPGSCPICGMDLIPVQGGHDHAEMARVSVSEHAAALMAIQVWPADRRSVAGEVSLVGTVDYDERLVHDVVLRTEGQVERLFVNYTNAPVSRGQRLAEIYSPAILAASQELIQAHRAAERSGIADLSAAARTQLVLLGVTEAQIDQILASGQPARTHTLYSPAGGIVTDLTARQGEWLGAGDRLMRVGGVGQVWVQFEAYEADLGRLRTGQEVRFTVEAFPGQRFQGPITFIDPVVDGARRTARARVQVPNPGGRLKPGMLARGFVTGQGSAGAPLVIPATAPLLTGTRAVVYVQLPHAERPTFEPRDVTLGARRGDFFEVAGGLGEGELVVVHGAFRLDSELQIRGGPSMMSAEGSRSVPAHGHGDRPQALPSPSAAHAAHAASAGAPATAAGAASVDLAAPVEGYLRLVGALASDDVAAARTAAAAMDRALGGVETDAEAWRRLRGRMTAALAPMRRDGADLATIRAGLQALSAALEEAAAAFGAGAGPLHRAYCPMAFDNQGATWLQRSETIANPYFGASMLRCGEVQGRVAG